MGFLDYEKISFVFQAKYLVLAIFALLASAAFTILSYRITNPPLSRRRKGILMALRIAAFFFLFISIFEPLMIGLRKLILQPKLFYLIDSSRSMEIEDSYGNRGEAVKRFLESDEVAELNQKYPVEMLTFGDTISVLEGEDITFDRDATAIGEILIDLHKSYSRDEIGSVILVSDGQSNLGITPLQVITDLPFPLYTIGVGDPAAPKDIALKRIAANEIAYRETPFPLRVYVESWGMVGEKVEVYVSLNKKILTKKGIVLGERGELTEVEFELNPTETGMQNFLVYIPAQEGEFSRKNNSRYVSVKVLESKRRVLLITASLNWEYTFLKRVMEADENIELVEHGLDKTRILGQIPKFPSTPEDLKEYECVIILDALNELGRRGFGSLFREYVGSGGSVLFFIQQDINLVSSEQASWDEILPFGLTRGTNQITTNEFNAVLTVEGRYHSITNIETSDNLPPEQAIAGLPPLEGFVMVGGLDEGAKSLLVHPKLREIPVLSAGSYKAGKTIAITGFPLWRWGFVPVSFGKTTEVYNQLVHNTIQWLLVKEELEPFVLKTDKNVYKNGERISISGLLRNENNQAISGATIEAELIRTTEDDSVEFSPLSLILDEYEKGVYENRVTPLPPGNYAIQAKAYLRDKVIAEKKVRFIVEEYSLEYQNVRMDENTMVKLAAMTGGTYFSANDFDGISEKISIHERVKSLKVEKNLWDYPILLVLFIILLAIEWIIRKRSDLL